MATQRTIERQPDKLDYLSPTQFKFNIHQLPKVEFFTVSASIPSISMGSAVMPTRLVDLPMMGDKVTYDPFTLSFIVDEYLENYLSLHEWITSIGFPKSTDQFKNFRSETSATPSATRGTSRDIGDVKPATAVRAMFSDATLTILSNKNNPVANVFFRDLYPTSLDALEFTQTETDVNYLVASASFAYAIYEIESI
jgi:hypothetical protein